MLFSQCTQSSGSLRVILFVSVGSAASVALIALTSSVDIMNFYPHNVILGLV